MNATAARVPPGNAPSSPQPEGHSPEITFYLRGGDGGLGDLGGLGEYAAASPPRPQDHALIAANALEADLGDKLDENVRSANFLCLFASARNFFCVLCVSSRPRI